MALKNIKHWSWSLLRSVLVGVGESVTLVLGMGGANAIGITMPTLTLKQFMLILAISAARSLFKYLKENPIPDEEETSNTITMKALWLFITVSSLLFTGCSARIEWKKGASLTPVVPPKEAVVRAEVSSIGVSVGQNQASQTPEVIIGYRRATYTRIPTSTNSMINAAPVRATIGVDGGLKPGIKESLETGDAVSFEK